MAKAGKGKPKGNAPHHTGGSGSPSDRILPSPNDLISPEERQRLIAEAAYFRAAERGFQGGDPVDDWLRAEAEINRTLPHPRQQKEDLLLYERLRNEIRTRLADIQTTVNPETIRDAIERAVMRVQEAGGQTAEAVNRVAESLKKDLASAAERMGPKWESFSDQGADLFTVWRDRGTKFLGRAAVAVGEWMQQAGRRMSPVVYRAGEMVGPGRFQCLQCDEHATLTTAGHLPPCGRCRSMEYRRV